MNCIVKSEDQNVLDMIQDVAQIRSCAAYHSIDLCVTKLSVTFYSDCIVVHGAQ